MLKRLRLEHHDACMMPDAIRDPVSHCQQCILEHHDACMIPDAIRDPVSHCQQCIYSCAFYTSWSQDHLAEGSQQSMQHVNLPSFL